MADRFQLNKLNPLPPNAGIKFPAKSQPAPLTQPAQAGTAQRRQIPASLLKLESRPLSAYDDNPVFDEITAARYLAVTQHCLKKWRQRRQGPDYIQYGNNGPVRYELKALMDFRDRHRIRLNN